MADGRIGSPGRNDKILFWASFLTLIAAGMGFSLRNTAVKSAWGTQFGFTQSELGEISGGGLTGFGITIIVLSFVADKIGYGRLMGLAFFFHLASAIVTLAAGPVYAEFGKEGAYWCLSIGMYLFAFGNGTCEAVINPLTATLYPDNKTHWLNILHAGWPAGLVLGTLASLGLNEVQGVSWQVYIGLFLVPVLLYGLLMFRKPFPKSEAAASGVPLGQMILQFASPILLFLLLLHAMVGYVELGTDSWISSVTGTILAKPQYGLYLFIFTSTLMFTLRFFAGPIVHRISPLGLLLFSAICGCIGLSMLGRADELFGAENAIAACLVAATIYGVGKTFFWPTMLGVVSERYPKGGAVTLGMMGGIGMLSAGLLGDPGIGFKQDYAATTQLQVSSPETYARYKADEVKHYPFLHTVVEKAGITKGETNVFTAEVAGLDNQKLSLLTADGLKVFQDDFARLNAPTMNPKDQPSPKLLESYQTLNTWWNEKGASNAEKDKGPIAAATLYGSKMALQWTAVVPALMAIGYLLLMLYFKATGGYRQEHLSGTKSH